MSELKHSLVLLLICAGLYGYLGWFSGIDDLEDLDVPSTLTHFVFEDPTQVRIARKGQAPYVLKQKPERAGLKPAEGWTVQDEGGPIFDADPTPIDLLLRRLASVEVQRQVEREAADMAPFGLAEPTAEVSWVAPTAEREAEREGTLRIGDRSPVGSLRFVAPAPGQAVYSAHTWDLDPFLKASSHYRDKRLFRAVTQDSVTRLEVELRDRGEVRELRQADGRWALTRPVEGRADDDEVRLLLSDLKAMAAQAFVGDDAAAASALTSPAIVVRAHLEGGRVEEARFAGRDPASPARVRASSTALDTPVTVSADLLRRLGEPLLQWRFRKVVPDPLDGVDRFEVQAGSSRGQGTRTGQVWRSQGGTDVSTAVGKILDFLPPLRAVTLHPEPVDAAALGLDPPVGSLVLSGGGARVEVEVGHPAENPHHSTWRVPGSEVVFETAGVAARNWIERLAKLVATVDGPGGPSSGGHDSPPAHPPGDLDDL